MIDKKWLETLNFPFDEKISIVGLLGVGSERVILKATDGEREFALKTSRFSLGYHLSEIPNFLSHERLYDPETVCRKLDRKVGLLGFDYMVTEYRNITIFCLKKLSEGGVANLAKSIRADESIKSLAFFLNSPDMQKHLTDLRDWPEPEDADHRGMFVELYAPNFRFQQIFYNLKRWVPSVLEDVKKMDVLIDGLNVGEFNQNPIYVWVGAVLDGFFHHEEEQELAAKYLKKNYKICFDEENVVTTFDQITMFIDVLSNLLSGEDAARVSSFLSHCGLLTEVRDEKGVFH